MWEQNKILFSHAGRLSGFKGPRAPRVISSEGLRGMWTHFYLLTQVNKHNFKRGSEEDKHVFVDNFLNRSLARHFFKTCVERTVPFFFFLLLNDVILS